MCQIYLYLWIKMGVLQYQYFRLQKLCIAAPHRNYLLSLSMRLCLSLRWATPSCVPLCTCTLGLDCADCQEPCAGTVLWLSHIFWMSLRGLRSTFASNGLTRLQLLLLIACLHNVSSLQNKEEKTPLKTLLLIMENMKIYIIEDLFFCFMLNNLWSFMANLHCLL